MFKQHNFLDQCPSLSHLFSLLFYLEFFSLTTEFYSSDLHDLMKSRETLRFDGFQRASLKYNANRNSFEYDRLVRKNAISAEIKLERTLPKQLRATQTRAYRVHFDAQRYLRDKMCIYQNDAAYGKCFASSYKHLNQDSQLTSFQRMQG